MFPELLQRVEISAETIVEAEEGVLTVGDLVFPGRAVQRFPDFGAEKPERNQQVVEPFGMILERKIF